MQALVSNLYRMCLIPTQEGKTDETPEKEPASARTAVQAPEQNPEQAPHTQLGVHVRKPLKLPVGDLK